MKLIYAAMLGLAVALFTAKTVSAQVQDVYPNKIVKLVVPFAAGGSTDLLARDLAKKLAELWRQPITVENRSGSSGISGTDVVAKANNSYTARETS
jgi:tripartite-type tricarboxylate transporter receptor subunit TctC